MSRIAWIAVALFLLTAAPAAQADRLSGFETGVRGVEATTNAAKIENKMGGLEATGASVEANGVKVETGGGGDAPVWYYALCGVVVVGWLLWKTRARGR
jgi:hypothetical protein